VSGPPVPTGADDLVPAWLSAALAPHAGGARVTDVVSTRIGLGNVADSLRLALTWDRPTAAPSSLVAKVPSSSETSRAAAAATRTYELEARFYNELAATVAVHRPHCYLSLHDPDTHAYTVLLEDLHPAEAGDQLAGCSAAEAASVMPELAALHAPRWDDPRLVDLAWLDRPDRRAARASAELIRMLWAGFLERYQARIEPDVLELGHVLMGRLTGYLADRPAPWTVVHGDFRLDNLLFGGPRVAVLDWQTVRLGPALSDVGYFIGSAFLPDDRRRHEEALVRAYHDELTARGVDLSWEDCWWQYRRYCLDGLVMGVAASMLVVRSERGDDLFVAMVNRHGAQAADLGADTLLGPPD